MAVIACKDCGGKVSTQASVCPHCGAKVTKKRGELGRLFMVFLVLLVVWYFWKGVGNNPSSRHNVATITQPAPSQPAQPAQQAAPVSAWSLRESSDAMTDEKVQTLRARSINGAAFEFPYNVRGGSHLSLVFRKEGGSLDAYMIIDKGQMICGVSRCKFELKIGDGKVETWTGLRSSSHRSDMIFVRDAHQLEKIVQRGTPIRIGIEFYKTGVHAFDFIVADYPGF